jgi:general secretion pathway protein G
MESDTIVTEKHMAKQLLRSSDGFSLIEILIALTLIGIAGTFVAGKIFDNLHEGQVRSTEIQMQQFAARLKEFRRKCGFYPMTDQGLEALLSKPSGRECKNYPPEGFIEGERIPNDPWDEPYLYESDGKDFNIISFGPDSAQGGEGRDADISYKGQGQSANGGGGGGNSGDSGSSEDSGGGDY